jgi:RNA polymerase sigma factor (sigma-70 family)
MLFTRKKRIKELTDSELIYRYQQSEDKELVGELFERYHPLVLGVCLKYLDDRQAAKDMVIEIFEKLFTDLLRHDIHNFSSWLHTVTRNQCLMYLRQQKTHHKHATELKQEFDGIAYQEDLSDLFRKEEILTYLDEAISELNEQQQICIRMFYLEEKSYREIEDLTGYPLMKVKSYIQNGKRNLGLLLREKTG